ncbi:putative translation initiation factor eIF-2B subunit gamma [Apostichopus japonicus]|uniref:Translation initiation factor eIF2B subunit gamma n=1 Tax=Stichopus japonicus TaxID=307972 RepID=A0A2G8JEP5_STIJA|nr:putative translation initiation factor eIF-2B subunit gamma [Apostichopus japonicus]
MEFQAVVMAAGRGSRMVDLTTNKAKPLLPIGNKPMLWYPLHMLEKAGFESAIVVILESIRGDLTQALRSARNLDITPEYVTIPDEEDWGTADTLRFISHLIKVNI